MPEITVDIPASLNSVLDDEVARTKTDEFANVAGRYQNFIAGRCHRHPTHPDWNYLTNMKNYDSLTESRMRSALLVVAAAVFDK